MNEYYRVNPWVEAFQYRGEITLLEIADLLAWGLLVYEEAIQGTTFLVVTLPPPEVFRFYAPKDLWIVKENNDFKTYDPEKFEELFADKYSHPQYDT